MSTVHNLEPLHRGDSREYTLTFTNSTGGAIDITGWKVYFTMKLRFGHSDDDCAVKKNIVLHDDLINGKTKIVLLPSDTETLKPNTYLYDIQIKRDSENILTVLTGKIEIKPDVTRRRE